MLHYKPWRLLRKLMIVEAQMISVIKTSAQIIIQKAFYYSCHKAIVHESLPMSITVFYGYKKFVEVFEYFSAPRRKVKFSNVLLANIAIIIWVDNLIKF